MGMVDIERISTQCSDAKKKRRSSYFKWNDNDRYDIGKYASEFTVASAVRKFKPKFPHIKYSPGF